MDTMWGTNDDQRSKDTESIEIIGDALPLNIFDDCHNVNTSLSIYLTSHCL